MAGKYIDFDRALDEAAERPVVVHFQGRDWTLFTSMPAKPVMRMLRLREDGDSTRELTQGEMVAFMSEMVPADVLEAWLDGGMTVAEMGLLLSAVIKAYQLGAEEDEEGEAEGPATGPEASSAIGPQ